MMNSTTSKEALDKVISKARVHLYKPIQIAEILYGDRVVGDIDLSQLETYRTKSKKWRDIICINFLGRTSTSSAKYQDDLFNNNAIPPHILNELGKENQKKNGIVEAYIYTRFKERYTQMTKALNYSRTTTKENFSLTEFMSLFWDEPGLRRSIDKLYEIIVYSLFNVLVKEIGVEIEVRFNKEKLDVLKEFEEFASKVICIDSQNPIQVTPAEINRVGVTNAADRGLDMWANFGPAIQVKHLNLNEKLAEEIVASITSDKIVIVCKDSEKKVIEALLNQLGWRARIQSVITDSDLIKWYNKALSGKFSSLIGDKLIECINNEIVNEFPSSEDREFEEFYASRNYHNLADPTWV